MPSVRYYNQTAPFWDFVASMENQGAQHPFFANRGDSDGENEQPQWGGWPFGRMPHRGHPRRPPPPPDAPADPHAPPSDGSAPPPPPPPGPPGYEEPSPSEPRHPGLPRGRFGHRGGCHGRAGRGFPFGGPPHGNHWADFVRSQIFGENETSARGEKSEDFKPEADVFDTPDSFVVHIALPGAKKEDVGVNWDAEKSELSIAGVIYRPGDEEFLKTLALDERRVGAFEKKIRLGSRASPAQVDTDGITARMEDGVLTVEVPKLDAGYVEIKKVDIE